MKKSLGSRIVMEHGLISNILPALELADQVEFANINTRTYEKTVPWSSVRVETPKNTPSILPKIDDITENYVCKRREANFEGEKGYFFGSVDKQTNSCSGEGVFLA